MDKPVLNLDQLTVESFAPSTTDQEVGRAETGCVSGCETGCGFDVSFC